MTSPWERLVEMAAHHLAVAFPHKHNMLLAGIYSRECEIFALDTLLHHGVGDGAFHRLDAEEQKRRIGGIEELLFEELPVGILDFYLEKMEEKDAGGRVQYL